MSDPALVALAIGLLRVGARWCAVVVVARAPAVVLEGHELVLPAGLHTLGGGVAGVGIGALLWLMDPLNPNAKPTDMAGNAFFYGSALGAIFGFYLLNNSVKFPSRNEPIQNFDDLLGIEKRGSLRRRPDKEGFGWRLPIYEFRF